MTDATAKDTTHNGYTNYETWCVSLWMDNEPGSHDALLDSARECYRNATTSDFAPDILTREANARTALADMLKAEHEEANPLADDSSVWSDLLSAALSEVNWREIAGNAIDEVKDDVDAEETEEAAADED